MDACTKDPSHGRTGLVDRQTENPVKKLKFSLLSFTLLFPLTACAQFLSDQTQSGARPDILVQYHYWWKVPSSCPTANPPGDWKHWVQWWTSDDGCKFRGGTNWLREVSTTAYPIIGPYENGTNLEIFRWHIKLAKAAGITAFMVSPTPGYHAENVDLVNKLLAMMRIAYEENFKIGFEMWMPDASQYLADWYSDAKSNIDTFKASPYASVLYKVDSLVVVWFNLFARFDTDANLVSNLFNQKQAYYWFGGNQTMDEMNSMRNAITNGSKITQIADYNQGSPTGCAYYSGDVSDRLNIYGANGYLRVAHAFPYMDESGAHITNPRRCLSNNGAELANYFSEVITGNAAVAIVESWNDFLERTAIEPGMDINPWQNTGQEQIYKGDPYRTLKQIAAWKGVEWQTPFLDCAIVDHLLQEHGVVECATAPHPPPP